MLFTKTDNCLLFSDFQDAENDKKNIPLKHQKENSECLSEAEGLLKDLFLDLDKAKKMKHPQTGEIEKEWVYKHQLITIQQTH